MSFLKLRSLFIIRDLGSLEKENYAVGFPTYL